MGWADPSGLFTIGGYEFTADVVRDALSTAWHAHDAADTFGAGDDGSHDGEPGYEESKHLFEVARVCQIGIEILTDTEELDGCFAAGTLVRMADGTSRAIEDVRPGDRVLTRSQKEDDAAPTEGGTVSATKVHTHDGSLLVRFADGSSVHTTPEHPFYVHGRGFTPAGELRAGDLVSEDGKGLNRVAALVRLSTPERVYNLTVAGDHTYFVGAGGAWLWVHNSCGDERYKINPDKQGRRTPGHPEFDGSRGEIIHPDPQKIIDQERGIDRPVPGGDGNEIVDFGEEIGIFRDKSGFSAPTSKGQIIPGRTGSHIVPSRP